MDALYNQTLHILDKAFKRLETKVPPPQKMPYRASFVFRYKEEKIEQALIQKLARVLSGLYAARLLCEDGLVQEQGAIQRTLDEFHEDILFLAFAIINKRITPLHQRYLKAFYQEEFDPVTGKPLLKRDTVQRKKIHAYLARVEQQPTDPSSAVTLYRTIHKAYSGFIHGASPQIMDMYGGNPPRFHTHGMAGTPRHDDHRYDLYNPFFRAIISSAMVANAFGDNELAQELRDWLVEFDKLSGRNEAIQNAPSRLQRTPEKS